MRLLFVTPPQLGHVRPAMPLLRALAAQGHRVAWATGPDALNHLAGEPVEGFPCGDTAAAYRSLLQARWPEVAAVDPRAHGSLVRRRMFEDIVAPAMGASLGACIDAWAPDVVVHDPLATAVEAACRLRALPRVEHAFGWPLPERMAPPIGVEIVPASLRRSSGVDPAVLVECRSADRQAANPAAMPVEVREWLETCNGEPLVLVSFGTVFHARPALRTVVEALASMPVRSIVLGKDREALGLAASPRQICVPWIEQAMVLPFCRAMVCHGGAGSVLGALTQGCPLLVLPQGADHFRNAAAVAVADAGIVLESLSEQSQVVAAMEALLDGAHDRGAEAAARQIAAMPSPAHAVARLVKVLE